VFIRVWLGVTSVLLGGQVKCRFGNWYRNKRCGISLFSEEIMVVELELLFLLKRSRRNVQPHTKSTSEHAKKKAGSVAFLFSRVKTKRVMHVVFLSAQIETGTGDGHANFCVYSCIVCLF
jgi:hypothetical protein